MGGGRVGAAAARPWPHDEGASLLEGGAGGTAAAAGLAARLVPAWAGVNAGVVRGEAVSGGLTNQLLRLSAGPERPILLLRLYGADMGLFVDRALEVAVIVQANAAGLGAPVLASFANGRFELFFTSAVTAHPADVPRAPLFHCIPRLMRRVHERMQLGGDRDPQQFKTMRRWLQECHEQAQAKGGGLGEWFDLQAWRAEADWMEALCARVGSPVCFCHNDIHALNVMIGVEKGGEEEGGTRVQLIDFEYGSFGNRGFDLGNSFNEWCGFECRGELYPSEAQRREFCQMYLGEGAEAGETDRLLLEAEAFSLVSHLFWGAWGILKGLTAEGGGEDFDYTAYARRRWEWYLCRKPEVSALLGAAPPAAAPPSVTLDP